MSFLEVVEQVETLSVAERRELRAVLDKFEIEPEASANDAPEIFGLRRIPPKRVFQTWVDYKLGGEGQPKLF